MNIQDLKLIGDSITGGGATFICLLDENGLYSGEYAWWTPDDGTGEDEGCWFDGDNWEKLDVTISNGQGFYLYTVDSGLSIQSSGQVKLESYSKPLNAGYNLVGNCSPVDLDVQKIKLTGDSITGGGANFICLLDSTGLYAGEYAWWTPDDGTGENEGCWFDGDNWEKISATIGAGEGLYLYTVDSGLTLTLPSAL